MHLYNIGYSTYEESDCIQLYHKKKFSKKEFEKIAAEATINVLKEYKTEKDEQITFQEIFHSVIEELIKNFGFKEVKFASQFNVFGWADILNEKDWEHDRGKQLNFLTKAIKQKLKSNKNKLRTMQGEKTTQKGNK